MIILHLSILNDEQRALVERIFHEHNIHFQRISFNIVKSEETAKDAVSAAFVKIMENIEKISDYGDYRRAFTLTTGTISRMQTWILSWTSVFTMPMCVSFPS